MNKSNSFNIFLEKLSKEQDNQNCFDCSKIKKNKYSNNIR